MEKELFSYFKSLIKKSSETIGSEDLGLGGSKLTPEDRVINVEILDEDYFKLNFSSDGINLKNKIAIERLLHKEFSSEYPKAKLLVNFKKIQAPAAPTGNLDMPAESARRRPSPFGLNIEKRAIPGVKTVIAVASGKGGVGKSTVSSNLAVSLADQGFKVGLLDADVYGPSAPLMLGLKGSLPISNDQKIIPLEAHGVKCVSFGFMSDSNNPVIWRGPLVSKAIEQFLYDVNWGELDYLVVDMPPGTGDVQMSLIENSPIHGAVIVTTPQDVAMIDAQKAYTMFEKLDVDVLGIIENMSTFMCGECGTLHKIFGKDGVKEFADSKNTKLLAELPLNPEIGLLGDSGTPAVTKMPELSNLFKNITENLG